ncbi:GAF domain-containing protein [Halorubrum vacuolatum]|uniref:MoeA N-terminal region (Domain I and II) n=1 Tax=Halorubrum vacuolatum TaxID=63740 RepID=A0A238VJY1_HALVU|nr:GAF domain-containing protein [Halorubrum vacuolatum]SNR34491.1 MoeA N-terminal region (domain I and II) [Halorubrum vacuolatum]
MAQNGPTLVEYIGSHNAKRIVDLIQFFGLASLTVVFGTNITTRYAYPILFILFISAVADFIGYRSRSRNWLSQRIEARLLALNRVLEYPEGSHVRFTYHRVLPRHIREKKFIMDTDIICNGNEQRGGGGRLFDLDKGVIGEAYRTREPVVYNCYSREDCIDKLTEGQNFDRKEAKEHAYKRSYLAFPIVDPSRSSEVVHGVVYFDSQLPDTFPQDESEHKLVNIRERDRSMVDGFAVRAEDILSSSNSSVKLYLQELEQETSNTEYLSKGCTIRVSWGEVLPTNADAVISESNVEIEDGTVIIDSEVILGGIRGKNVDQNTKKIISTCRDIKADVISSPSW